MHYHPPSSECGGTGGDLRHPCGCWQHFGDRAFILLGPILPHSPPASAAVGLKRSKHVSDGDFPLRHGVLSPKGADLLSSRAGDAASLSSCLRAALRVSGRARAWLALLVLHGPRHSSAGWGCAPLPRCAPLCSGGDGETVALGFWAGFCSLPCHPAASQGEALPGWRL